MLGTAWLSGLAALPAIGGRLPLNSGLGAEIVTALASNSGLVERMQLLLVVVIIAASTQALTGARGARKPVGAVHKQQLEGDDVYQN